MSIGVHSKAPGRTLIKLSKQVLTALFKWLLASQRDPPVLSNSSTGSFLFFTAEHARELADSGSLVANEGGARPLRLRRGRPHAQEALARLEVARGRLATRARRVAGCGKIGAGACCRLAWVLGWLGKRRATRVDGAAALPRLCRADWRRRSAMAKSERDATQENETERGEMEGHSASSIRRVGGRGVKQRAPKGPRGTRPCPWSATSLHSVRTGFKNLMRSCNSTSKAQLKLHFHPPPSPNQVGFCKNFTNISCRPTCLVQLCLYEFGPDRHGFQVTNSPTCLHGN
jgi:hypothetical protein